MRKSDKSVGNAPQNEGEGSRTAAKKYNDAQAAFVKSGKVSRAAQDAKKALEGPEREAMQKAEKEGLRHARH